MGLYVYVTRRPDPLEDEGPDITLDEWRDLVESDSDLVLNDPPNKPLKDPTIYAEWKSYPGGYSAWYGLFRGNIEVKGIDDALLSKLRIFAAKLRARIVSEEGEAFE